MRTTLPLSRIVQGKNPRRYFDPTEMAELEDGVRAYGVVQEILVRPIAGTDLHEIVAGERRWRAARNVFGDDYEMPVNVMDVGDTDAEAITVIENFHRADMSVAKEALAAQRQLYRNNGNKDETARQLGWHVALLERRLALLACTPRVLEALTERRILLGHAELLAGVPPDTQDKVLANVVAHQVAVAVLKKQLGQFARRLADAIFDTGQCGACIHNSARQAGLFAESLGDGYCQHPTHFDELTMQAIEAKAAALRDEYQTIKIVKASDGFVPLRLAAEGELGVGAQQYVACKGCQSFGCAVSALPGSYGQVTGSLCFDAACNTNMVARQRKSHRDADRDAPSTAKAVSKESRAGIKHAGTPGNDSGNDVGKPKSASQPSLRVLQYRVEQWRKWVANVLMTETERNQRVLIALALSGRGADLCAQQYANVVAKIAGGKPGDTDAFPKALERADGFSADCLARLVQAVAASAAFGVDEANLVALLNYLDIEEARNFQLDKAFLDLFTMNELESLAEETGLHKAMGERFKLVRAGKKDAFVAALLSVKNFAYRGAVPQCMRYPRKPFRHSVARQASDGGQGESGRETEARAPQSAAAA
ncbi:ParB family chromosome partitioning protein [Oxalobacteraceae bacterium GrIS 1.11]